MDLHPKRDAGPSVSIIFFFAKASGKNLSDAYCNHYTANDKDSVEADLCLMIHGCKLGQILVKARQRLEGGNADTN